jgi:hypothetical protein
MPKAVIIPEDLDKPIEMLVLDDVNHSREMAKLLGPKMAPHKVGDAVAWTPYQAVGIKVNHRASGWAGMPVYGSMLVCGGEVGSTLADVPEAIMKELGLE